LSSRNQSGLRLFMFRGAAGRRNSTKTGDSLILDSNARGSDSGKQGRFTLPDRGFGMLRKCPIKITLVTKTTRTITSAKLGEFLFHDGYVRIAP